MNFTHLHVHSQYSFLDGASTIDDLLQKAKQLGMPAMALTDHNRLTGAIRFYEKAKALDIKPVIGAEINVENGYHLTLLCKNKQGYSNLCRLITDAHLSNRGKAPIAAKKTLAKYNDGLIAFSGCDKGELPVLVNNGRIDDAKIASDFYRTVYGEDFFIELIRYPQREYMSNSFQLIELAREKGLPVVATNNVHYANMDRYRIKELLNAIDQNIPVSQLKGFRTVEQYLKSAKEMNELFSDIPEAIDMTEEIAGRCNFEPELGKLYFPGFDVPKGESESSYLSKIALKGAKKRYEILSPQVIERLQYELTTIEKLGFCGYFLVVWDIVRWAKARNIRCQARGSAVDSLVVYALGISTIDPVMPNLLFERFMHELRREPPDIDLDIDRRRRDEVRDYVYDRYGAENVSCIGTINTYMARGAIRDVGKALELPENTIDEACAGIHWLSAAQLLQKMDNRPELRNGNIYRRPEMAEFFKLCASIDCFPKHLSVHLGGLLISKRKLSEMIPLEWSSGGDIISQYDKDDIEKLGIVKMDLLALPTLTVIEDTITNIRKNRNIDINLDNIDPNDPQAFAMLREGGTIGTFQLESPAQREMAGRLLPDRYEDIIISISLVRPGPLKSNMDKDYLPRRHKKKSVTYLHPKLENALDETLGVILYQEQVLKVAHDLAGMSYAEADGFRRAMTHDRSGEEMENMRESFISSAAKNGVNREISEKVFEQLAAFAAYGFCKAHAAAYAELAYQTLWLKCHYPAEFFAAILSNQPMGYYPPRVLLAEAKRSGVKILPLDINNSCRNYSVEGDSIRIGLMQLKGISSETIESILSERDKSKFDSFRDFILRVGINRRSAENLIKTGACSAFDRADVLLSEIPILFNLKHKIINETQSMFGYNDIPKFNKSEILFGSREEERFVERKLLSLDISSHPLDFFNIGTDVTHMKDLKNQGTGNTVCIAGSVIRYQTPPTRNGKRVMYIIMEDGTGIADITVFGDVQEKYGNILFREGWLLVKGKIQRRGPMSLSIIAEELSPLEAN